MMRTLTSDLTAVSVLLLGLGLLGCADAEPPRVAVLLPLTGDASVYGKPVHRGVLTAQKELAEAHARGLYPTPLTIEIVDTESDPRLAAMLLEDLYKDGVVAAIGGVTNAEAEALAPIAEKAERVLLSPTASSSQLAASRHVFRLFLAAEIEAAKMASFAALELGLHQVAVMAPSGATAQSAADTFTHELERNGGEVLDRITYSETQAIRDSLVEDALRQEPKAVYVADFSHRSEEVVRQLRIRGYRGTVLATSALTAPALLAADTFAQGALVTQVTLGTEDDPKQAVFAAAFEERWGEPADLFAAHGYDAMQVLALALSTHPQRASELWKGFRSLDDYRGVTGFVQFDQRGKTGRFPRVFIVEDGRLDPAEADAVRRGLLASAGSP